MANKLSYRLAKRPGQNPRWRLIRVVGVLMTHPLILLSRAIGVGIVNSPSAAANRMLTHDQLDGRAVSAASESGR